MRIAIIVAGLSFVAATAAGAQVYVRPHVTTNGTVVQGHMRTAPNSTRVDNWSTAPNVNPYTGRQGTQNPYPVYRPQAVAPRYTPAPNPYAVRRPACTNPYGCF